MRRVLAAVGARRVALAAAALAGLLCALGPVAGVDAAFSGTAAAGVSATASTAFTYRGGMAYQAPGFYLSLDDAPGSATLADLSPGSRPGTNPAPTTSSPYGVAGAPVGDGDAAVHADGVGGYVLRDDVDPVSQQDYSVELWFRVTGPNGGLLAGTVDTAPWPSYWSRLLYVDAGGRLTYGDWTGSVQTVRSAGRVDDGAWHHAVGTHGGSTLTLTLDGVVQGTTASPPQAYNARWVLGGANIGWSGWPDVPASNFVAADLDEFAYYRYALTGAQVAAHRAATAGTAYAATVRADDPAVYWRLDERDSPTAADAGGHGVTAGYALTDRIGGGRPGAVGTAGTAGNTALWFPGRGTNVYQPVGQSDPQDVTALVWFRTPTARGGVLLGFADVPTGQPSAYDRQLYLTDGGRLVWGVYDGSTRVVVSPGAYADDRWHFAAVSVGPAGLRLLVDGVLVASDAGATRAAAYAGYWRLGGSWTANWPAAPSSDYYAGYLDEFAVVPHQMADGAVADLYRVR